MASITDKFYNMQVNLIKNGRIYAEKAAIKNIWQKEDNILLDIYFHRLNKAFVFDSVFIHDIIDLNNDKYYTDIEVFAQDFAKASALSEDKKSKQSSKKESSLFDGIKNDLILLLFMARIFNRKEIIKEKIVCSYIQKSVKNGDTLSDKYLMNYIARINPTVDDFYLSLKNIKSKTPQQAKILLKEIIKICLSDGYLHYAEKMYLADIIQTLRVDGLKIPKNII